MDTEKDNVNIEDYFTRLDEIIAGLDRKDVKLKESFDLYKEGVELVKKASEALSGVEKDMITLEASPEEEA